jgi:3-isopropylmalate/(R)-2-methylmalate dehydratase large subunit
MQMTMTQKILSAACGKEVFPGDVINAPVSGVAVHDSAPLGIFDSYPDLRVWDPSKIVICYDHFSRTKMAEYHGRFRAFVREQGIPAENVFTTGRQGLSHQVPAEEGYVLPGTVYAVFDTQGATLAALNCFAFTSLWTTPSTMALGTALLVVPDVVDIELTGQLPPGLTSKDLTFHLQALLGEQLAGRVVEFRGPGVASLSIDQRLGVSNAANNLGVLTMIFPGDDVLEEYLRPRARQAYEFVSADPGATYAASTTIDLRDVPPLVCGPHDIELIKPLDDVLGLPIDAAFLGSCSAGRLEDLALAAQVIGDRKIDPSVRLIVTPISTEVMLKASEQGIIASLTAAGAVVTPAGCGACYYANASPLLLGDGERCISTSVSNAPGRMGSKTAEIYLTNPAVVAASALEGRIAHPGPYLSEANSHRKKTN